MSLPATKNELISRLLKFWGVPVETSNAGREIEHPQLEVKSLSPANNSANTVSQTNVELLAQQFSEWFFKMLNQPDQLPAEHFWPDAKLIIHFSSPLGEIMESREDNPEEISSLLFRTKVQHNLLFNPNLTAEGTKGRLEPHGLVAVMACGTLHSGQYCVGVFEQSFSLARDPLSENNWKIKHSRLNLRSNDNVTSLPALRCCD